MPGKVGRAAPPVSNIRGTSPYDDHLVQQDQHEVDIIELFRMVHGVSEPPLSIDGIVTAPFAPPHRWYVLAGSYVVTHVSASVGVAPDVGEAVGKLYLYDPGDNLIDSWVFTIPVGENVDIIDVGAAVDRVAYTRCYYKITVEESPGSEEGWVFQVRGERIT
jgi:hypothetical protein